MNLQTGEVTDGAGKLGGLVSVQCPSCGRVWLGTPEEVCPGCFEGKLGIAPTRTLGSPELSLPFAVEREAASSALQEWVERAPFPDRGLSDAAARLTQHWVPLWMVDARVTAHWEAELGFDYKVQSTVEKLNRGMWTSVPTTETRVRWEQRAGTVDRWYDNQAVPALTDWAQWSSRLGNPSAQAAERGGAPHPVLLPTRLPDEVWPDAERSLLERVGLDLKRGCRAEHIRDLFVNPRWEEHTWSWLLVPVWSTHYVDELGESHVLHVDGREGRVSGKVMASARSARRRALLWAVLGLVSLVLSVLVALPALVIWPLILVTMLGTLLGFVALGMAIVPLVRVRSWNAKA